jgi:carboxyl-terminal processing protease
VGKGISTKPRRYRAVARRVALLLGVVVLVLAGEMHGRSRSPAGISDEDKENVALFAEALRAVKEGYVDRGAVDPKEQTYAAIRGMLASLGDEGHTRFETPEETEQKPEVFSGTTVGTGLELEDRGDKVIVKAFTVGHSPAKEAGIEPGDVLTAVDGESVVGEDITGVYDKLEGTEGSKAELAVLRDGEERKFAVNRAGLEPSPATWNVLPEAEVGHLRLARFSKNSAADLEEAIAAAREAGARRFLLDLRGNTGGWMKQAEKVAAQFLPAGSTIYIKKTAEDEGRKITVPEGNDFLDAPLVVLIDEGSASCAEILAGALKDNGRARILGKRTSGIGTVIEDYPLSDGSTVYLAVAEWLTPSGDLNWGVGIAPTVETELEEGQQARAPEEVRGLSMEETLAKDAQLERALEVLQEE